MSTALTIDLDSIAPQIAALLPPDVPLDRFRSVALAAIRNNPKLLECNRQSLYNACLQAAQDGLLPDGREGAIVPRKGIATWQPMVLGIYKRVKGSGSVASLPANVVYAGEQFEVLLGDEDRIVHKRDLTLVGGEPVAVYAIATMKDGSKEREVMTWAQVQKVRKSSATPNAGPWVEWPEQMAQKTVVRRLAKRLPVLDEGDERLHSAINRVDALYDFGTPAPEAPALPAAAATIARAPRVADPTVYETPKPAPERKSWAQWADSLEIAVKDSSTAELGKLLASAEVTEIQRLAELGDASPAKTRILNAIADAERRYLADPPEPDKELPPIEIAGQDKVGAG